VPRLIPLDGSQGEGGGQILRTALSLAAATGQGFELTKIRARRSRPGLRPQHLAAVRAAGIACGAKLSGIFEGSPDLRFEPGPLQAGQFRFEIETAGAASLVLQTVLPPLALAQDGSAVEVTGGTHVPRSPSADFLGRHWASAVARVELRLGVTLRRAGFYPKGGGELLARVRSWRRPVEPLLLEQRGALERISIVSGAPHVRGSVAERQAEAARARLWETRRLEPQIELAQPEAAAPGSYLLLEAVFANGRAAFGLLGERGLRAERLGDQGARLLLKFLEGGAAVDRHLADQLAVPLALSGGGGRISTDEVTSHLETVADVLRRFGVRAETWGRRGGPGGLSVERA
jgi:RNA 3'-terminal phosphate cyclase (ATP)